jgi:general secretion pathway protein C
MAAENPGMEWLKRHFWAFNLLTIGVVSMLLAWASSHFVEARFLLEGETKGALRRQPVAAEAPQYHKDTQLILKRNIFCSDCPSLVEVPGAAPDAGPASDEPVKSTLPISLVTTLVSDDPRWSLAILRHNESQESGAFQIMSELPGGSHVDQIEELRVYLRTSAGRLEYLEFESGTPTAVASAPPPGTDRPPVAERGDADLDAGIKQLSEGRYTIQRGLLDKLLADTNVLAKAARVVPATIDGKPSGFKLYAIRPKSVYAKIGLQNGDTIRAINGNEMTSPDRALEIYTKLKSASHLSLSILRRGKDKTFEYQITG